MADENMAPFEYSGKFLFAFHDQRIELTLIPQIPSSPRPPMFRASQNQLPSRVPPLPSRPSAKPSSMRQRSRTSSTTSSTAIPFALKPMTPMLPKMPNRLGSSAVTRLEFATSSGC